MIDLNMDCASLKLPVLAFRDAAGNLAHHRPKAFDAATE